ncbi:MAG: zinc protease [Glaciecola sp.]|uniref:insulinase family protein n=1 Tax=Congregibacter sp. TaxID=2744308 RepID=UPI0039E5CD08
MGDTSLEEIIPVLECAFRGWKAPPEPLLKKDISAIARRDTPRMILIDKPGSEQSMILAGSVVPGSGGNEDLALDALNDLLGGSFNSRLNMNLREDKGWSYGTRTTIVSAEGPRPLLLIAPGPHG